MENFQSKLEQIIKNTFEILRSGNSESRLVFPAYSNGDRRVSEQELRFMFVEQLQQLLQEYNYYYSIETPTKDKYIFSNNSGYVEPKVANNGEGKSASFDLTIKDEKRNNIAIIEFKAKNAHPHEYAKDICKLRNPNEKADFKYFINLFEKIEKKTKDSFIQKLGTSNRYISSNESSEQIIVIAQSLRRGDESIKKTI